MKTIMIIGAGEAQVPLIEAARKERYRTVVCDFNPSAPGVPLADEFCNVSTKDRDGLLNIATSRNIDGVVANSEYAMCDVAHITNKLGLVGNPESAIETLSSKSGFRELQKRAGLFAPKSLRGEEIERLLTGEGLLPFPIVIKPDKSSGTRGTTTLSDPTDLGALRRSVDACSKISRNGKVTVEEYIPMPAPVAIEGEVFVHHGEILWDGLFLTIRSRRAIAIPMTYVFPLQEEEGKVKALKEALATALRAAGVLHGEYNVEAYITGAGEPFIIEINPRQGGNDLPKYVQEHCGIDLYRLLVTTSVGNDIYWDSLRQLGRERHLLVHHMLYPRDAGLFRGIRISDQIASNVYRTKLEVEPGAMLAGTIDASSSIGYVDLSFASTDEQLRAALSIEELIRIEVECFGH